MEAIDVTFAIAVSFFPLVFSVMVFFDLRAIKKRQNKYQFNLLRRLEIIENSLDYLHEQNAKDATEEKTIKVIKNNWDNINKAFSDIRKEED